MPPIKNITYYQNNPCSINVLCFVVLKFISNDELSAAVYPEYDTVRWENKKPNLNFWQPHSLNSSLNYPSDRNGSRHTFTSHIQTKLICSSRFCYSSVHLNAYFSYILVPYLLYWRYHNFIQILAQLLCPWVRAALLWCTGEESTRCRSVFSLWPYFVPRFHHEKCSTLYDEFGGSTAWENTFLCFLSLIHTWNWGKLISIFPYCWFEVSNEGGQGKKEREKVHV